MEHAILDGEHPAREVEVDPAALERLEEPRRDVAVAAGGDLREHLEDRHVGADLAEVGGQLEPDVTAADDGDALGHLGEVEDPVRVEDMLSADPRDGRDRRPRPGGDEDILGLQLLVADLDEVAPHQASVAADHLDACRLELAPTPRPSTATIRFLRSTTTGASKLTPSTRTPNGPASVHSR